MARKSFFGRFWSRDRRRGNRQSSLPLVAYYYWDGGTTEPRQVRDISPAGLYLLTEQRWYPNTVIAMTLTRTDKGQGDADRSIRVVARVVREGIDGVGMSFVLPASKRSGEISQEADAEGMRQFLACLQADTGRTFISSAPPVS
jgi:hypothetical protein